MKCQRLKEISKDINFRDVNGCYDWYEAISVIEFDGTLSSTGHSEGHYRCDVKEVTSKCWFKTNDDRDPAPIEDSEVSQYGYVVLFKRI